MPSPALDVVVVGAGLSGLVCAVDLHKAGKSVVVLEALDRVGGKILSVDASPLGGKIDLGAAWLNDTNQAEIYALAKEYKFDLIPQRSEGLSILHESTGSVSTYPLTEFPPMAASVEQGQQLQEFIGHISQLADSVDLESPWLTPNARYLDSMSIKVYLATTAPPAIQQLAARAVGFILGPLLGAEAAEMSFLYFLDYIKRGSGLEVLASDSKHGAQYLRNRQGNQAFCDRLRAQLPPDAVQLSSPVRKITQQDDGATSVETASGQVLVARKVVVSIPTTLYETLEFSPSLPPAKQRLADSTALGYWAKVVFVFDQPWWRDAGLSGVFLSEAGPASSCRDTSSDSDGQYSLSTFVVGDLGREWSKYSRVERRRRALEQFHAVFETALQQLGSSTKIPEPTEILEKEWTKQPFISGAPVPYTTPGVMTSGEGKALRTVVGNVHFVGTELARVWKGYMDGAVRSGRAGAVEVLEVISA